MKRKWGQGVGLLAASMVAGLFWSPGAAEACGGFFCNRTAPVAQSGEQIIFAKDADGRMTAHVRIEYEGGATEFAWILPVPSVPTVGLGTEAVFMALNRTTSPDFRREFRVRGTCLEEPECRYPEPDYGGGWFDGSPPLADSATGTPEVEVASQGNVGPYETAVIRSTDGVDALLQWLQDNDYDIPDETGAALADYVADGDYFVALRLQKDRGVGEIQPITLEFEEAQPCIPIKLTRIATIPDMPITAYVLGAEVAAVQNYRRITPAYDEPGLWTRSVNYWSYISDQVDDASGKAFVTEFAGDTPDVSWIRIPEIGESFRGLTSGRDVLSVLSGTGIQADPLLLGLLQRFMPVPEEYGGDAQSYYNAVFVGLENPTVDANGLADALTEAIIEPRDAAARLVEAHAVTTRMSTTMSAEDMTLDPIFDLEEDAPRVSNIHTALNVTSCGDERDYANHAPRYLELASGRRETLFGGEVLSAREYCENRGGTLVEAEPPDSTGLGWTGMSRGEGCSVDQSSGGLSGLAAVSVIGLALLWRRRRRA